MIDITELDELLNTLLTSSLEPHEDEMMEFSNKDQTILYNYILELQQIIKNQREEINKYKGVE